MFRNVTGAQEAVVHRQSEDSLIHEKHQIKLIKDVQSDDIAQAYPTLKKKWFHERQELIENLKYLQKHKALSREIQRIQNLIECFNELIENGEVNKNCQLLINEMKKKNIQLLPETYAFNRKPLGDKMIRLPRHISKTAINISNPPGKQSIDDDPKKEQIDDRSETEVLSVLPDKVKSGLQFYVVAEQFRPAKTRKKYFLTSSIIE